jgi:hypothetical protein
VHCEQRFSTTLLSIIFGGESATESAYLLFCYIMKKTS